MTITRQNLKKLFYKNHKRIMGIYNEFNNLNLDEYFAEKAKKQGFNLNGYCDRIRFSLNELESYGDLDDALIEMEITNQKAIELIKEEFDESRLESTYYHAVDRYNEILYNKEDYDFSELFYYKDNQGKSQFHCWEIDGDTIELELMADDKLDMLNKYNNYNLLSFGNDIISKGLRYYFNRGLDLREVVDHQFEVLLDTVKELNRYKRELKKRLEAMKQHVENCNNYAETVYAEQLRSDIADYIEENSLIISGDVEKIKFDYIAKIDNGKAITNKGAVVPVEDAKRALEKFLSGVNIINNTIGSFTVKKIFEIKDVIFIRIGCHLIKIDEQIKQQLIN
jgi:hypothetical protein